LKRYGEVNLPGIRPVIDFTLQSTKKSTQNKTEVNRTEFERKQVSFGTNVSSLAGRNVMNQSITQGMFSYMSNITIVPSSLDDQPSFAKQTHITIMPSPSSRRRRHDGDVFQFSPVTY